jgi:hypothetical protein
LKHSENNYFQGKCSLFQNQSYLKINSNYQSDKSFGLFEKHYEFDEAILDYALLSKDFQKNEFAKNNIKC